MSHRIMRDLALRSNKYENLFKDLCLRNLKNKLVVVALTSQMIKKTFEVLRKYRKSTYFYNSRIVFCISQEMRYTSFILLKCYKHVYVYVLLLNGNLLLTSYGYSISVTIYGSFLYTYFS